MKRLMLVGVLVLVAMGGVWVLVATDGVWAQGEWPPKAWPEKANDFIGNSLYGRGETFKFFSRVQTAEQWGMGFSGHGLDKSAEYAVAVLFHPESKGCWIGNVAEPHNWTPAPTEVCR